MIVKRKPVSKDSMVKHAADVALAGHFDDLLAQARFLPGLTVLGQSRPGSGPLRDYILRG